MRIALYEHDRHEATSLARSLEHHLPTPQEPVSCVCFHQIHALRAALRSETFDLLLFDADHAREFGMDLLHWLRKHRQDPMPVIVLSSCAVDQGIAAALEAGADDHVLKPFRPLELRARIRKLMQRKAAIPDSGHSHAQPLARMERFGHWLFNHSKSTVSIEAAEAAAPERPTASSDLTHREFVILIALFRRIGQIVSRTHLVEIASLREEDIESRALDNHIYRLRKRFESQPHARIRLRTIYAQGYRLEWADDAAASDAEPGLPFWLHSSRLSTSSGGV